MTTYDMYTAEIIEIELLFAEAELSIARDEDATRRALHHIQEALKNLRHQSVAAGRRENDDDSPTLD
jgi:hypothetical protein